MSKKRHTVTIIFSTDVDLEQAHKLTKIFQDRSASHLAYKKYKTIKTENIKRWRKDVRCMVCNFYKGKQCRGIFHFLNEEDAALFKEYADDRLQIEYKQEIFDIE